MRTVNNHLMIANINWACLNFISDFFFHRTWVLVNSKGVCQNLISIPKLALVQPSYEDGRYLCLNAPGMTTLKLDIHMKDHDSREKRMVKYVVALRDQEVIFLDYHDHQ